MRWSRKVSHDRLMRAWDAKQEWHRWFAWYPVNDGANNWFWFCVVETKCSGATIWHYREFVDLSGPYYVLTPGGSRCDGTITDRVSGQVKFKLNSEKQSYWMPKHLVFKGNE